jgi:lysozyme family protein
MIENFQKALAYVLEDEGGNSDDPEDHGGRTSRGITQREYDAWCQLHGDQGLQQGDVWNAANAEIATIYRNHYWLPWCDALPAGLDYSYFDMAVNAGPHRATVLLQRAIGIAADGVFGPITLLSATRASPKLLLPRFCSERVSFYKSLRQPRFLRGWLNRAYRVEDRAMAMLTDGATT